MAQDTAIYNRLHSDGITFGKKDTLIKYALANFVNKYFTGYGTWGSLPDTVRGYFSVTKIPLSYSSSTGVFDFDTTTHHSYAFYQTVFGGGSGGSGWSLTGNSGIDTALNFLGTTDSKVLRFRQNNTYSGFIGDSLLGNTAFGFASMLSSKISSVTPPSNNDSWNTAYGYQTLRSITTGYNNMAMGRNSLYQLTTGHENVAVGQSTGSAFTTGYQNVAVGETALGTTGSGVHGNVAVGNSALKSNIGNDNIAIGDQAISSGAASGGGNIAIGGLQTMLTVSSGANNTGIGQQSLGNLTTGSNNFAGGYQSNFNNSSASFNISIGDGSLFSSTTGAGNIAIGHHALYGTFGNASSYNVAIGQFAGKYYQGGGTAQPNPSRSILIGDSTRPQSTAGVNEIVIGVNVSGLGSNTTVLGDSSTLISKIYGITSFSKGANVASASAITATGNLFHVTGTTTITSINTTNITDGARITIIFDGILTFTDGGNLKLAGNFTTSADATITLVYDGSNFYETSRSVN